MAVIKASFVGVKLDEMKFETVGDKTYLKLICSYYSGRTRDGKGKYSRIEFVANNPQRIEQIQSLNLPPGRLPTDSKIYLAVNCSNLDVQAWVGQKSGVAQAKISAYIESDVLIVQEPPRKQQQQPQQQQQYYQQPQGQQQQAQHYYAPQTPPPAPQQQYYAPQPPPPQQQQYYQQPQGQQQQQQQQQFPPPQAMPNTGGPIPQGGYVTSPAPPPNMFETTVH